MTKRNKKILLIIPSYNEEGCIVDTCLKIDEYNKKSNFKLDYIVINDGSTDKTGELLDDNNVNHIDLIQNLGIGGAVQTGYKYAYENNYDIAVQFDADGQHDINSINNIINPIIEKKSNMVIGSRFIDNSRENFKSSKARRAGIKIISWTIKFKTRKKIYDTTSGFRAIDKNIIKLFSVNYPLEYPEPISTVDVLLSKYNVLEVYVKMNERTTGTSSIKSWKNLYYMINVILTILLRRKDVK